ncbi:MAG: hypothetical protein VB078_10190 [Clostridiaceae bacterium]|nr:hypothetical protein [Clostridiaceae bacterium]
MKITAAIIMAAALLLSFFEFPFSSGKEGGIVLPKDNSDNPVIDSDTYSSNLELLKGVDIGKDNIKRLIAAMHRPDKYHISVSSTVYHSEGQKTYAVDGYVDGSRSKTVIFGDSGKIEQNCILAGDSVYIWSQGSKTYYHGKAGSFTDDDYSYIPTYEKILQLEDENILSADFSLYNDVYCLFAETTDPATGYRNLYYISVENGLLVGAQSFDGDTLAYALSAEILEFPSDEASIFTLPDGTVISE